MAGKIGDNFVTDMIDRGRREVASFFYPDSNIAQPMYPFRGSTFISKEVESPGIEDQSNSVLEERLARGGPDRDDPGRDDPDMDRE
jgi:hypothetical protein